MIRLKLLPPILSAVLGIQISMADLEVMVGEILNREHLPRIEISQSEYRLYPADKIYEQIEKIPKHNFGGCVDIAEWNKVMLRQSCPDIAVCEIFGGRVRDGKEYGHLWIGVVTQEGTLIELGGKMGEYDYITYMRF